MTYINVNKSEGVITAIDLESGINVTIDKTVSDLYRETKKYGGISPVTARIDYAAVTYLDKCVLSAINRLFCGSASRKDMMILNSIVVRYGWLDKTLNSLSWVPVIELYGRYCQGKLSTTDKGKIGQICKVLSLSRCDMVKVEVSKSSVTSLPNSKIDIYTNVSSYTISTSGESA